MQTLVNNGKLTYANHHLLNPSNGVEIIPQFIEIINTRIKKDVKVYIGYIHNWLGYPNGIYLSDIIEVD